MLNSNVHVHITQGILIRLNCIGFAAPFPGTCWKYSSSGHWLYVKLYRLYHYMNYQWFMFVPELIYKNYIISVKFVTKGPINNFPALVQIMAWCRPSDRPLSEPMRVRLPTHICVIRPQWVKTMTKSAAGRDASPSTPMRKMLLWSINVSIVMDITQTFFISPGYVWPQAQKDGGRWWSIRFNLLHTFFREN